MFDFTSESHMSRRYFDRVRVAVEAADEADPPLPTSFVWRRRRFRVNAILARWIEAEEWWKSAAPVSAGFPNDPTGSVDGAMGGPEQTPLDRVVWRLEASVGPSVGVFDLCQTSGASVPIGPVGTEAEGNWFLMRSFD